METIKINLENFNYNNLIARLLCLQSNFNHNFDITIETKQQFIDYCTNVVKENFIYPEKYQEKIITSFGLFLLGNKQNMFDNSLLKYSNI